MCLDCGDEPVLAYAPVCGHPGDAALLKCAGRLIELDAAHIAVRGLIGDEIADLSQCSIDVATGALKIYYRRCNVLVQRGRPGSVISRPRIASGKADAITGRLKVTLND